MIQTAQPLEGQLFRDIVRADEQGQALALMALEEAAQVEKTKLARIRWSTYEGTKVTSMSQVEKAIGTSLNAAALAQYHHGMAMVQVSDPEEIARIYRELGYSNQIANIQAGQVRTGKSPSVRLYTPVSILLILLARYGVWGSTLAKAVNVPLNISTRGLFRLAGIEAREVVRSKGKVADRTIKPAPETKADYLPPAPNPTPTPILPTTASALTTPVLPVVPADSPRAGAISILKQQINGLRSQEGSLLEQLHQVQKDLADLQGLQDEYVQAIQVLGGGQ